MKNLAKAKIATALILSFAFPASVLAASEMELRMNWADAIGKLKKNECKNEHPFVINSIDTAAAFLFHGEYDEAKETLRKGREKAKSKACKKAIKKNEKSD